MRGGPDRRVRTVSIVGGCEYFPSLQMVSRTLSDSAGHAEMTHP